MRTRVVTGVAGSGLAGSRVRKLAVFRGNKPLLFASVASESPVFPNPRTREPRTRDLVQNTNRPPNRTLRWPPVVPVICPNVLPVAMLYPVFGLPQRTAFGTL
jgi:hypothetical protein